MLEETLLLKYINLFKFFSYSKCYRSVAKIASRLKYILEETLLSKHISLFRFFFYGKCYRSVATIASKCSRKAFIIVTLCYERILYSLYRTITVTAFLCYSLSLLLASILQPSLRVYIDLLSIYILLSN